MEYLKNYKTYIKLWFQNDVKWKNLLTITRTAEAASIFGVCVVLWSPVSGSPEAYWGVIFLGSISLFLVLDNILLKGKIYYQFQEMAPLTRKAKLAESLVLINSAFSEVHGVNRLKRFHSEKAISSLIKLCDFTAQTFNNYTNSTCSVCIKVFDETKIHVVTLCRDSNPNRKLSVEKDYEHDVKKNTAFMHIMQNLGRPAGQYFMSNNLPQKRDYCNTSFELYSDNFTFKGYGDKRLTPEQREEQWPLPYSSTLIVPIDDSNVKGDKTFVGYLCVDSKKINSFDSDISYYLLSGISEGLYNVITKLLTKLNNG